MKKIVVLVWYRPKFHRNRYWTGRVLVPTRPVTMITRHAQNVDLGKKEYNHCYNALKVCYSNIERQYLKTLRYWEMPDWRLRGVAESRDRLCPNKALRRLRLRLKLLHLSHLCLSSALSKHQTHLCRN